MPDILITEYLEGPAVDALASGFEVRYEPQLWREPARLTEALHGVRALIVRNQTQVDVALLSSATSLVVIGRAGVGLDNIALAEATARGVQVVSTPDQNAISVAELALGMMLALARHIPTADADTHGGNWNRQKFLGTELYGKALGVVGLGKIGWLTARRAHAFGMRILAADPFVSPDNVLLNDLQAELVGLDTLLARADVVTCHLPANPQTTRLFDRERFALMRPSALFINTSRGEVVDEAALLESLQAGRLAGAALDVRAKEPPVAGELESLPNVLLMPHIGALTREAQARVTTAVCEDVARVLRSVVPLNPANRV